MESDFKELKPGKSLEDFRESDALWYARDEERKNECLDKKLKALVLAEIKKIAEERLTNKQKQVFYLFLQGKSQREMGRILLISRNSVKCRWKGIVKNLRKHTTHLAYYWKLFQ
jgi:DNA-binding NarL/FixJ family response regulator